MPNGAQQILGTLVATLSIILCVASCLALLVLLVIIAVALLAAYVGAAARDAELADVCACVLGAAAGIVVSMLMLRYGWRLRRVDERGIETPS